MNICLYLLGKLYYMRRNKAKTAKWESFTDQVRLRILLHSAVADLNRKRSNISRLPMTRVTSFLTLDSFIRYQSFICNQNDLERAKG
jgi:hypothetical protein